MSRRPKPYELAVGLAASAVGQTNRRFLLGDLVLAYPVCDYAILQVGHDVASFVLLTRTTGGAPHHVGAM